MGHPSLRRRSHFGHKPFSRTLLGLENADEQVEEFQLKRKR